jgi:hypothetical protein
MKSKKLWVIFSLISVVLGSGFFWFQRQTGNSKQTMVKIIAINANYKTIQIPGVFCHDVTTEKKVKNKNRNFFNGLFDSKNHPEYITRRSMHKVCETNYTESRLLENYTIHYKFKNFVESMQVKQAPQLNSIIPLIQLQLYQESSNLAQESMNSVPAKMIAN